MDASASFNPDVFRMGPKSAYKQETNSAPREFETTTPKPPSFLIRCALKVNKEAPDTLKVLMAIAGTNSRCRSFAAALVAGLISAITCVTSAFSNLSLGLAIGALGVGFVKDALLGGYPQNKGGSTQL